MHFQAPIARLAERQHGYVAYEQLRALGLSAQAVRHQRRRGALLDRYRGVYGVGHLRNDLLARASAARLAAGPRSALTGMSAAAVFGAVEEDGRPVELVRPTRAGERQGLVIHRGDPGSLWYRHDLPLTSPVLTLAAIAESEPGATVVRVYNELQVLRLLEPAHLRSALPDLRGRHALAALKQLAEDPAAFSRSGLEDLLRPLLRQARLPAPDFNATVLGYEVDAVFAQARVVVELDGRRFHSTDVRFESDRARDARLAAAGYVVLRLTYRRLTREPLAVIAELAAVLSHRRAA